MKNLTGLSFLACLSLSLSIWTVEAQNVSTASLFQPRQSSRPARTLGEATRSIERCGQNPVVKYVGLKGQEPIIAWQIDSNSASQAEFALFDRNGKGIYQATVPLNKEAKEIAVNLPQTLQPNQEYQWVLSLVCQPNERLQDQTIMGWIETTPVR